MISYINKFIEDRKNEIKEKFVIIFKEDFIDEKLERNVKYPLQFYYHETLSKVFDLFMYKFFIECDFYNRSVNSTLDIFMEDYINELVQQAIEFFSEEEQFDIENEIFNECFDDVYKYLIVQDFDTDKILDFLDIREMTIKEFI
jgi:hypothetical protein